MTSVFAVWKPGDEWDYIEHVFATRALAEAYLSTDGRAEYDRLAARAGLGIPRVGYKIDGVIIPQVNEDPGTFEEWAERRGRGRIEELEVLDELPSQPLPRVSDERLTEIARETIGHRVSGQVSGQDG